MVRRVFLGQECEISRLGTNGDFDKAVELFKQYDGQVDAFGVGGIEFFLRVADRRWYWRDARRIRAAIRSSKVGDGNGVKGILERRAVVRLEEYLNRHEGRSLRGMRALKTHVTERYDLAEALVQAGCQCTFGDFMFGLGLPIPLHRLSTARGVAGLCLPIVTRLPYRWLYPLGEEQDREPRPRWTTFFRDADVIAGDFNQIRMDMPDDLKGKVLITNTTTDRNVEELRQRNLHILVTATPRLDGRTFGTNVIEAVLLALMNGSGDNAQPDDFRELIERIPLEPNLEVLNA
jgi:hypothetical protein